MFKWEFQGGPALLVFAPTGKNPTKNLRLRGKVTKLFDRAARGFVFECSGGPASQMRLPAGYAAALGGLSEACGETCGIDENAVQPWPQGWRQCYGTRPPGR